MGVTSSLHQARTAAEVSTHPIIWTRRSKSDLYLVVRRGYA